MQFFSKFDPHLVGNFKKSKIYKRLSFELYESVPNILRMILVHSMYIASKMQIECSWKIARTPKMRFKYNQNISNTLQMLCEYRWIAARMLLSQSRCAPSAFQLVWGAFGGFWCHSKCYATWIVPPKWSECFECCYNDPRIFGLKLG